MRIALLFEFPTLSGGEYSMLAIVERLGEAGIELVALAPPGGRLAEALEHHGIPPVDWSVRDGNGRRVDREPLLDRLDELLDRVSPDLVHANSLSMGRLTGALARRTGRAATAHLRDIVSLSAAAIEELNANRRLIAVSQATRDHHVDQGLDAARTVVIHNGIEVAGFPTAAGRERLREQLGLPAAALLVATIGQVCLRKGQDVLAEAAARCGMALPEVHFLLVGERYSTKTESIEFERAIHEQFARAGLSDRFHPLGFRDDVPELLDEIDIVVHPAQQEPLGRVLLEASASGRAIIATRVGGTPEILDHDESALLVPPGDPAALAEAIEQLAGDPTRRSRLGTTARERVAERFGIEPAAAGLVAAWRQAIG